MLNAISTFKYEALSASLLLWLVREHVIVQSFNSKLLSADILLLTILVIPKSLKILFDLS